MRVVSVASQKGGVGKTTLSLHLACALSQLGVRVLLVDADPQGAIGLSLGRPRDRQPGLSDLMHRAASATSLLIHTRLPGLSVLTPGTLDPVATEGFGHALGQGGILARVWSELGAGFDVAIVDTPAGFGAVTLAVLGASEGVLGVLQAEPISLRSAPQLLQVVVALRQRGHDVRLLGFALNLFDPHDATSRAVLEAAFADMPPGLLLRTLVQRDAAITAASAASLPVMLRGNPPPPVAGTFQQLALEVGQRCGVLRMEPDDAEVPFLS